MGKIILLDIEGTTTSITFVKVNNMFSIYANELSNIYIFYFRTSCFLTYEKSVITS